MEYLRSQLRPNVVSVAANLGSGHVRHSEIRCRKYTILNKGILVLLLVSWQKSRLDGLLCLEKLPSLLAHSLQCLGRQTFRAKNTRVTLYICEISEDI